MTPDSTLTRTIHFPYSGITMFNQPKITFVLSIFQDMASEHAAHLKVSGFDLLEKGYKWVIARYHIRFHSTIKWMDRLTCHTWRTPHKNLYEVREFNVEDHQGDQIVSGSGVWIMVNNDTSRPVRLSRFMTDEMIKTQENKTFDFPDIEEPVAYDFNTTVVPGHQDIDLNQHVNNTVYIGWAIDSIPSNHLKDLSPDSMSVIFHNQAFHGQNISIMTHVSERKQHVVTCHQIVEQTGEKRLAMIEILWNKSE
ncbi:MAG: hypothetical protein D3926_05385 [Desulfobacteraceae bacterium]|nr:MAG: hypothetical protein D3926_05385 [Desulfobacteraceae bacterium]